MNEQYNEQFNHETNENNQLNEREYLNKEITTHTVDGNREIPAMVKVKKEKKGRGKTVALTLAVALASFGAGSLYTSYNWIQDQVAASETMENTVPSTIDSQSNALNTVATSNSTGGLSVAQVAHQTADSIVEITTETVATDLFMRQYVTEGAGSGVVITKDGYIATNNHVIEGASKITVRLTTGEEYEAKLVGTDSQTDVAVLKVESTTLKPVTFANSDSLVVGDTAIAVGNPLGQLGGTVTNGIISALDREIELESQTMTLLQTNAAINPGNSGGGLFNDKGELIGLVVAKSAGSGVEGLGFAIPANVVKEVVESIMDVGYVQGRPVLGVSVVDINSAQLAYQYGVNQLGVYIMGFTEGSKAEKGGLKVGDCIVAVEDTQINSTTELKKILQGYNVGDTVSIIVSRKGKLATVKLELTESVPVKAPETAVEPSEN